MGLHTGKHAGHAGVANDSVTVQTGTGGKFYGLRK
jgi:hypothetical protein